MRIEHLAEFVDLASTLSYTETAERLLLSESALSRHIKGLEDELGVALFERSSRRVRLSSRGAWLLPKAAEISAIWRGVSRELKEAKAQSDTTIGVDANYYIGDIVAAFCAKHSDISVRLGSQGLPTEQLLQLLSRADHQFVAVTDPPELPPHLASLVLTTDTYVAALPTDHRLAKSAVLNPADLAADHFISFPVDTDGDREIKSICRAAGFEPNIIFSSEVGSSIAKFVRDGLGVSLLRHKTIQKMAADGVAYVPLDPPVENTVVLCWDRRTQLSAAAGQFLTFVRDRRRAELS